MLLLRNHQQKSVCAAALPGDRAIERLEFVAVPPHSVASFVDAARACLSSAFNSRATLAGAATPEEQGGLTEATGCSNSIKGTYR